MSKKEECDCVTCTCGAGSRLASAIIAGLLILAFLYVEYFWS